MQGRTLAWITDDDLLKTWLHLPLVFVGLGKNLRN